MDLLSNLALGLETAFTPVNLLYCFIGVFLGTLVGVLPDIGALAAISMLFPLTFHLEPTTALIMLAGNLMGGHADVYISNTASVMPYVNNGQVEPLVILGPGNMDPKLVEKINADTHAALERDTFKKVLADNFVQPGAGSPSDFKAQVEKEMDLWSKLAQERSIVAQ